MYLHANRYQSDISCMSCQANVNWSSNTGKTHNYLLRLSTLTWHIDSASWRSVRPIHIPHQQMTIMDIYNAPLSLGFGGLYGALDAGHWPWLIAHIEFWVGYDRVVMNWTMEDDGAEMRRSRLCNSRGRSVQLVTMLQIVSLLASASLAVHTI